MTDLVAEVADESAIRLVQRSAPPLALRVVCLGDVDGDDSGGVAGERI